MESCAIAEEQGGVDNLKGGLMSAATGAHEQADYKGSKVGSCHEIPSQVSKLLGDCSPNHLYDAYRLSFFLLRLSYVLFMSCSP